MLSGDILEESWGYQELTARAQQKGFEKGLHEGELHALRGLIVDIAQRRFPTLVTLISNRIQQVDDTSQLRSLSVELSTAQTVQEAEQAFRALVKDAQQH